MARRTLLVCIGGAFMVADILFLGHRRQRQWDGR